MGYIRRADPGLLRAVFDKYATQEVDGKKYMSDVDFLIRYLGLLPEDVYNRDSAKLLSGVLDTSKDKCVSPLEQGCQVGYAMASLAMNGLFVTYGVC